MEKISERTLVYREGVSKGVNTYGDTLISLTDGVSGKKFMCNGGGYDMLGTVLADWMAYALQEPFKKLLESQGFTPNDYMTGGEEAKKQKKIYGAGISKKGHAFMDGAVGYSEVEDVIRMLGYEIKSEYLRTNRRNGTDKFLGYRISPKEDK